MTAVATTTRSGQALAHEPFSKPPLQIPNALGEPFKTELVEERSPERTVKWNFWHLPDDDREPHNHPWDFESTIFHGGLTERRYWVEDGKVQTKDITYKKGDVYTIKKEEYHTVIAVEPGTVTRMVCGQATPGNEWGYLNIETGEHSPAQMDPSFIGRLRTLNRFMIPKS